MPNGKPPNEADCKPELPVPADEPNRANLLALADYMAALFPDRHDQTRAVYDDGSPSCLLSHMLFLLDRKTWERTVHSRKPGFMGAAAEKILAIDYGMAACLYAGGPWGSRLTARPLTM